MLVLEETSDTPYAGHAFETKDRRKVARRGIGDGL